MNVDRRDYWGDKRLAATLPIGVTTEPLPSRPERNRHFVSDAKGLRLSPYFELRGHAEAEAEIADRRRRRERTRNCITCGVPFHSTGPHHRMCADCRYGASE